MSQLFSIPLSFMIRDVQGASTGSHHIEGVHQEVHDTGRRIDTERRR